MHKISKNLYKLYKKHNPSKSLYLHGTKKIKEEILENKLKFPLRFFKYMDAVDVGCGTGDYALIYSQNGANIVKGYDFNEDSIRIAKKVQKKLKIKQAIFEKKEFFSIKKKFDFVSCTGVLHHLPNSMKGLKFLTKRVKKKGFLFLAFGIQTSNIQHNLMKLIVRLWGNNEKKMLKATKMIFPEHIRRSVKYGFRNELTVINDQFINEQHNYLDLKKVLNLLRKDFTIHSSWPNTFLPRGDSPYNNTIREDLYENYLFSLVYWSLKNYDDKKFIKKYIGKKFLNYFRSFSNLINNKPKNNMHSLLKDTNLKKYLTPINKKNINLDINLNELYSKYHKDIKNLFKFISKKPTIKEMAIFVKNLDYLFKGACGLGLNYFLLKRK